ncbi:nicotinate-nucleotide adenylyltransferase [Elysia marginata]|uniref:Nicotinate-nucleotide adenylyltransferase n=1 Tax=Elysia marginata TaxID=1093978 RepID=A0AAV4I3G1_9GAST|nr:nicotinate-nucleotide adenylyltransferase [Elysia marginata]
MDFESGVAAVVGNIPSTTTKALKINLERHIYGTFTEIGAGQETVRHFFRVGGASGTIAKAISAYDKNFSDSVYGSENGKQYVSEDRLKRMLDKEIGLLEKRLNRTEHPEKCFFVYANTVATIDHAKKYKGHGWVGIRFQLDSNQGYNDIILHIRFKQNEASLQQETLGILGVNLIYGAYFQYAKPARLLQYLYDNIGRDTVEIDTINFSGPHFSYVDNRLMSLELIKNGMTEAVMFNPKNKNILAARVLYKKNILAFRGTFRPVTKVHKSMYESALKMFLKEKKVEEKNTEVVFEITLSNLLQSSHGEINERDFLDRADLLRSLGFTVIISNFKEYYRLAEFFGNYTKEFSVLTMGVNNLVEIFDEKYYRHLSGGILEAFGKLFFKNLGVYLYPMKNNNGVIENSQTLKVHPRMKELYKFFKLNGRVVDIKDFDTSYLEISSHDVLEDIMKGGKDWEDKVPEGIADLIKKERMFGYTG